MHLLFKGASGYFIVLVLRYCSGKHCNKEVQYTSFYYKLLVYIWPTFTNHTNLLTLLVLFLGCQKVFFSWINFKNVTKSLYRLSNSDIDYNVDTTEIILLTNWLIFSISFPLFSLSFFYVLFGVFLLIIYFH